MNKILTILVLSICTCEVLAQSDAVPLAHLPAIAHIHAIFEGTRKTPTGITATIPGHTIYHIDGYEYLITLELSAPDPGTTIDSTIGIVCIFPGNSIWKFLVEPERVLETSTRYFEYSFPFEIQKKGWYYFILASKYEIDRSLDSKSYQEVSNQQSIYLDTPSE